LARTRLSRGGDYVPPDANVVARGLFIDAVVRLVPKALAELNAVAPHLPDRGGLGLPLDPETLDQERPLREWCLKFGFTAVRWAKLYRDATGTKHLMPVGRDWLLELARDTAHWLRTGDDPQKPSDAIRLCVNASYPPVEGPPPPSWNIDLETERSFIGRQKAYRGHIKKLAIAAGRVLARRLNQPRTADRDFEWLALFQVGRLEAFEIRARCKSPWPSVDTIREAIEDAAKQAGVHLRAARRGRPRDE
jgi:hypothetical protein